MKNTDEGWARACKAMEAFGDNLGLTMRKGYLLEYADSKNVDLATVDEEEIYSLVNCAKIEAMQRGATTRTPFRGGAEPDPFGIM